MKRCAFFSMALSCAVLAFTACKAARWRGHDAASSGQVAAAPERVNGADATVAPPGPAFDVDDKTGRPKSDLVVRLDFFPEPVPGGTNLPVCMDALADDFELGDVLCDGHPESKVALVAGNLLQECYTHPDKPKIAASRPLVLPGCKRGMVLAHGFHPTLRIDVQTRDVSAAAVAPAPTP